MDHHFVLWSIFQHFTNEQLFPLRRICKKWKKNIDDYLQSFAFDFKGCHLSTLQDFINYQNALKSTCRKIDSKWTTNNTLPIKQVYYAGSIFSVAEFKDGGGISVCTIDFETKSLKRHYTFKKSLLFERVIYKDGYIFVIFTNLVSPYSVYCFSEKKGFSFSYDKYKWNTWANISHIYTIEDLIFIKSHNYIWCCQTYYLTCVKDFEQDIMCFRGGSDIWISQSHNSKKWILYSKDMNYSILEKKDNDKFRPFTIVSDIFVKVDHVLVFPTFTLGLYLDKSKKTLRIFDIFSNTDVIPLFKNVEFVTTCVDRNVIKIGESTFYKIGINDPSLIEVIQPSTYNKYNCSPELQYNNVDLSYVRNVCVVYEKENTFIYD